MEDGAPHGNHGNGFLAKAWHERTAKSMEVTIRLTASLANRFAKNEKVVTHRIESECDLLAFIEDIDREFPGIKSLLITDIRNIPDSINIYVNGENVRYLEGIKTTIHEGDVINVIPAAAAG